VELWDTKSNKLSRRLGGKLDLAYCPLTYVGREPVIAWVETGGTLRLRDARKSPESNALAPGGTFVSALAGRPDGKALASVGSDRLIRVWTLVR